MKNPVSALQDTLVAHSTAIGQLQADLTALADRVARLEAMTDELRTALRSSVDDLSGRVGAMSQRLEELGR